MVCILLAAVKGISELWSLLPLTLLSSLSMFLPPVDLLHQKCLRMKCAFYCWGTLVLPSLFAVVSPGGTCSHFRVPVLSWAACPRACSARGHTAGHRSRPRDESWGFTCCHSPAWSPCPDLPLSYVNEMLHFLQQKVDLKFRWKGRSCSNFLSHLW